MSLQEQLCAWPAWATQPSGLSWDTGTTSHSRSAGFQLLEAPVLEHRVADSLCTPGVGVAAAHPCRLGTGMRSEALPGCPPGGRSCGQGAV